MQYLQTFKLP